MKVYNKLVRDRIPDIIRADGHIPQCETLDTARYLDALEQKLLEEAAEYRQTPCMEEMADLMEVQAVKQEKAAKRGAFEKRIFLHAVAEPDELLDR